MGSASDGFFSPVRLDGWELGCILLGGSMAYSHPRRTTDAKDWDGAVIVSKKTEIVKLINENRAALCRMLSIVQEECPNLVVPDQTNPLWAEFDGVRLVGWTADNIKKGVKILSLEYFLKDARSLNILSFKDKRVFSSHSLGCPTAYTIIQQATRVTKNLVILHEQTVYTGKPRKRDENQLTCAVFGVTANLLITSKCVYGNKLTLAFIKRLLLKQFVDASGTTPSVASLPQSSRFDPVYARELREEFSSLCPKSDRNRALPLDAYFYGPPSLEKSKLVVQTRAVPLVSSDITSYKKSLFRSVFSSNSMHGMLTTLECPNLFWKESSHQDDEIHGARLASTYFPRVQHPQIARSGELIYDWFEGSIQAELRLSYLRSKMDESQRDVILFAELRKAEDTLRAWTMSMTRRSQTPISRIHRFFYERLRERRFKTFYKAGVEISDQRLPFHLFYNSALVINDCNYPSLSVLFTEAESLLFPNQDWGTEVFGLGDGHGGNVMIGSSTLTNSAREILYIDYEVAGFHSAILDIAKPLYNDVFFNIFYNDVLGPPRDVFVSFEPYQLTIDVDVHLDSLSRAIMEIKQRYLLEPFWRRIQQNATNLFGVKDMRRLGFALLVCALLSRDFSGHWDSLFANIAVGVTLSQFTAWKQLECYVLDGK